MKKYLVKATALEWHKLGYIVEAHSEEEAKTLVEDGEGDFEYDDYDGTDQFEVDDIKEYED